MSNETLDPKVFADEAIQDAMAKRHLEDAVYRAVKGLTA